MSNESANQSNYQDHPLLKGVSAEEIFNDAAEAGQEAEDAVHAELSELRGELTHSQFTELQLLSNCPVPVVDLHLPEESLTAEEQLSVDKARDLMTLVRLGYAGIQQLENFASSTICISEAGRQKLNLPPFE